MNNWDHFCQISMHNPWVMLAYFSIIGIVAVYVSAIFGAWIGHILGGKHGSDKGELTGRIRDGKESLSRRLQS